MAESAKERVFDDESVIALDVGGLLADKYRVEHEIARGGMGSVWRGTHVTLDRPVAIKFVTGARRNDRLVERFLREAKTAAAIRHPNVIDIVDFGTNGQGDPFMVMELLEGETLLSRIRREPPLTTGEIVHITAQLLSGLDAVHRAGIVHRDLKPANVFVSGGEDGEGAFARLLDFGISYSIDPESELRRGRFGTDEALVVGTPEYMAPEQAEGRPDVDLRADLYAVGVMLYEMLAGVLPFDAEHPGAVLHKVMTGMYVPLATLRPELAELSAVVAMALDRDRQRRPQSARELRRLLLSASGITPDGSGPFMTGRISSISLRVTPDSRASRKHDEERPTQTLEPEERKPVRTWRPAILGLVLVSVLALAAYWWTLPATSTPSAVVAPPSAMPRTEPTAEVIPSAPTAPTTTAVVAPTAPTPPAHTTHRHATAAPPPSVVAPTEATAPAAPARRTLVHDLDF